MNTAQQFLSIVRARTEENITSFNLLHKSGSYSVCVGLLRQELDSLLRLCYLWKPETDPQLAVLLMQASIQGKKWKYRNANGEMVCLTDRTMLRFASELGGWEKIVYDFGCKAIHLSGLHAYKTRDPLASESDDQKTQIVAFLTSHHAYNKQTLTMDDIYQYLPKVMDKLVENVAFYLEELEHRYAHNSL